MKTELKKLKFLWKAANSIATWEESRVKNTLKSHYLTMCRKILHLLDNNDKLCFNERRSCSNCSSFWIDGNYKIKIVPQKTIKKGKKLIAAYKSKKQLTKKQKKRAKWILKNSKSYCMLMCNICHHKTKILLKKPIKSKTTSVVKAHCNDSKVLKENKKIKNKRKKNKQAIDLSKIKLEDKTIKNNTLKRISENPIQSTSKDSILICEKPKINNTKPSEKKKNVKKSAKLKQKQKTVVKVQQKNNLMQLAHILKKNSNSNQNKNDNLKSFLK